MKHWGVGDVAVLFLLLAFVVGLVLALSVITKSDDQVECDRANQVRAQLILLVAFVLGVIALVAQRYELSHAVQNMLA